jgi:hypothetical protein
MSLTPEQVERLASKKNVRRIAVENFLSSLEGLTREEAMMNLEMDAATYKWNAATISAISEGISISFKRA